MSVQESIPLVFSGIALLVALYGVLERQRGAYSAMRVRITELLSEADALNVEENKYWDANDPARGFEEGRTSGGFALAAIGARRALLTYQALSLLQRLSRVKRGLFGDVALTPSEYASLAHSLMRCGDLESAKEQWLAAVAQAESAATDRVRAVNFAGLAECLFELRDVEGGRAYFRRAVDTYMQIPTELRRQLAFGTCFDWLDWEQRRDASPVTAVEMALTIAQEQPAEWGLPAIEALRSAATRTVYTEGGGYAAQIPHLDELLSEADRKIRAVATAIAQHAPSF